MVDVKRIHALTAGAHKPNGEMCFMEAVAYVAGEPWSDRPTCVSPYLGALLRAWNDTLPDDASRSRLLAPLIPVVLGTSAEHDEERDRMLWQWMARVHTPAWLDLVPELKPLAEELRTCGDDALYEVLGRAKEKSDAAWDAARDAAWDAAWAAARDAAWAAARDAAWDAAWAAARDAAWDAARDAAWDAARDAARDAAWDAARDAAWAAARDAARDAAWAAAWDAAWAAARAAAWDAARDAARDALAPTVATLQDSFVDLIKRMAALGRTDVAIARPLAVGDFEIGAQVAQG